jgi:hypothetical protein
MHGTGAALRDAAAVFGTGKADLFPDHPQQGRAGIDIDRLGLAIDCKACHLYSSLSWLCGLDASSAPATWAQGKRLSTPQIDSSTDCKFGSPRQNRAQGTLARQFPAPVMPRLLKRRRTLRNKSIVQRPAIQARFRTIFDCW